MSKTLKRSLAVGHYKNDEHRSSWKSAMIQAELVAATAPKSNKQDQDRRAPILTGYVALDGSLTTPAQE